MKGRPPASSERQTAALNHADELPIAELDCEERSARQCETVFLPDYLQKSLRPAG